jgi:hypothetical protein
VNNERVKIMEFKTVPDFLRKLDEKSIFYTLSNPREDSIMITVSVPGQRWEIEFMENGTIEIEKFCSDGTIYDEQEIERLFKDFSD